MHRLIIAGALVCGVLLPPALASGQQLAVVLDVRRECATAEDETALISELRFRLPQATVMVGNTSEIDANWRVGWSRDRAGDCKIEVAGEDQEPQSLLMPDESESADIELAASQVAWILTMHRSEPAETDPREIAADAKPSEAAPPDNEPAETSPTNAAEDSDEAGQNSGETRDDKSSDKTQNEAPEARDQPQQPAETDTPEQNFEVVDKSFSLIPGRSFPAHGAKRVAPRFALGLIGNEHWGLSGFEFGIIYNRKVSFMDGMQVAVAYNQVGNRVGGMQLAMGANLADGSVSGIQTSMVYNSAAETLDGLQLTMGWNAAGAVRGIQTALLGNSADGVDGLQLALGLNLADDVDGMQAGMVNVADRVNGVQVGLVNISDTVDVPIGLVNIMTDEPLRFVGHTSFSGFTTVGLLHGGRTLRYLYLAGFKAFGDTRVYGAGLGLSLKSSFGRFFADPELIAMQVSEDSIERLSFMAMLRVALGWRFAKRFAIFLAPSATLLSTGASDGLGLVPGFSEPTRESAGAPTVWVYPEVHLGFRF